ncbi:hypothetical protein J4E08_08895 [Sagittula sp. NFXS13]|uniref:hypothetical protein n=1 Tax=Sagittula sp. NFXS13 TaxID=2819095 RepID=UPI0032DF4074
MLELTAALYRKTDHWAPVARQGGAATADLLGRVLAEQLAGAVAGMDTSRIKRNFVVSTMLDLPFTSGWLNWADIAAATRRYGPDLPGFDNLITGYECASWGYCLRYALKELEPGDQIALSVLDINVMNISYWQSNPNWGNSGFGLATIVLTVGRENRVECHMAKSVNAFGEFCLDLRRVSQQQPDVILVPPYFPRDIAAMYTKIVPEAQRTENLVDDWGHCFGADPWVGLIEEVARGRNWQDTTYFATSVALNGYWTYAKLRLNPKGRFALLPDMDVPTVEEAA